ncbi:type II toxin-antitoxin system RelE/ParE family toxin [Phragmitibacter flavus]|uniref:Type II toxin-antitoxin system RelE/ParE family toxin n=1 Tax=Phragmitibacter flavus TaxID=2576071 RepID=A0A5R8KFK9_9BACT|nr:type II toxin-antitoxin system RelE/ParE family toxin [Phragmitibacter flavus]TLD71067.1 type II toxin-antitoxin system RelE/ParE family toxin [Phragmitibacter flavus]
MASYRVEVTRSASKDIRGIDKQWIPKIVAAIESLGSNPRPSGCKNLVGSEHTYRVRVGDYRIIYDIQDDVLVVLVVKIRHRKDVYR